MPLPTKADVQRHLIAEFTTEAGELEERAQRLPKIGFQKNAETTRSAIDSLISGKFEYSLKEDVGFEEGKRVPHAVIQFEVDDIRGTTYIDLPTEDISASVQ